MEKAIGALPPRSMERFSAIVQPILLNRCGANQCHGPNAKSAFKLLRPPAGQVASRRFTERNLFAILQQLDASQPASSPLLMLPQRRHGSALTAIFDKNSQKQLDELSAWVQLTLAAPATSPATISAGTTTLSQPAVARPAPPVPQSANETSPQKLEGEQTTQPKAAPQEGEGRANTDRFVPRDRFDPAIFNRRYHRQ
jgi:hypothetical protein